MGKHGRVCLSVTHDACMLEINNHLVTMYAQVLEIERASCTLADLIEIAPYYHIPVISNEC